MTTSVPVRGDSAMAVKVSLNPTTIGRVAFNAYGFNTPADAVAAGFNVEAGPAMPIYLVSQAQLDSGEFILEGDPLATPVYTSPAGMIAIGQNPLPCFVVNGWTGS